MKCGRVKDEQKHFSSCNDRCWDDRPLLQGRVFGLGSVLWRSGGAMSSVALQTAPLDVESCLIQLSRYGAPFLMQSDSGTWSCSVKMRVNATGVTFDVQARGGATPLLAAQDCYRNMIAAINTVNKIGAS